MPGAASVWLRCEGCQRTFRSLGLALAHQRPGPTRTGQYAANVRRRNQSGGGAACTRADIVSVTVHHASGLQRPRVSVVCVHAGRARGQTDVGQQEPSLTLQARPLASPVGDGGTADTPGIDPDYEQDAQDAVDMAQTRMRDMLTAVYTCGTLPVCSAGAGGMAAPPTVALTRTYTLTRTGRQDTMTPSETRFTVFRVAHRLSDRAATDLLRMVQHPDFCSADLRYTSANVYDHRLADLSWAGIHSRSMHREHLDGTNGCRLWYRTAGQIVLEMLEDESLAQHIDYTFAGSADPTSGERVFSGVRDSCLLQSAYARFPEDDVTVILVFVSSDATCVRKRSAEHPFYVSLGQLSLQARQCDYAWRLAGCVPAYEHAEMRPGADGELPSHFEFRRRVAQILRETAALILAGLEATGEDGVYTVKCGDGVVRKIRLVLGGWLTDRQEHEVRAQHP